MVVGSNPTGSTRSIRIRQPVCSFVWISGVVAERSNATVPKAAGVQAPRRFESSLLREPRMKIVPMRGLSRLSRCAPESQTLAWMVGRAAKAQSC